MTAIIKIVKKNLIIINNNTAALGIPYFLLSDGNMLKKLVCLSAYFKNFALNTQCLMPVYAVARDHFFVVYKWNIKMQMMCKCNTVERIVFFLLEVVKQTIHLFLLLLLIFIINTFLLRCSTM